MSEVISRRIGVLTPEGVPEEAFPTRTESSKSREVNRNLIIMALVVAAGFIGCSLFYVWSHHQIISLGYEISQASGEEQQLLEENKKLRLELAALKAPSRIERMAQQKLGFVTPQKEQLIIVR